MYVTEAIADRIEVALSRAAMSRLTGIARLPGNPLGVEQRAFGNGHQALLVAKPVAHYAYFSRPFDLRAEDTDVEALVAWYRQHGAACYMHISPRFATEQILERLHASGLRQSAFVNVLCGAPRSDLAAGAADMLHIRRLEESNLEIFLELWTRAAPEHERDLRQRLARAEFSAWQCFAALWDDQPAAYAAMYVDHPTRTAVLAAAGTLPDYRGRGCQTALIHARLLDATRRGCTLVAVEAAPGSTSQHNLERAGLQVTETHAIWTF